MSKFIEWWKAHYARNMGLTIVLTVIVAFFVLALFGSKAEAADYQLGVDTEKVVTCVDATTRVDGSPLAVTDIKEVHCRVTGPSAYVNNLVMVGGCRPASIDLTGIIPPGLYTIKCKTIDTGDRQSVDSPPVNFTLLPVIPANPNPPTNIQ